MRAPRQPTVSTTRAATAPGPRRGFTLVELLTVISIIAILMSILVPTVGVIQLQARKSRSIGNLKSVSSALSIYAMDHGGLLPAPIYAQSNIPGNARNSSNPTGATWIEELIAGSYVDGTFKNMSGSSEIEVQVWPGVLTDPQFVALHGTAIDDVRGYGMNTKPFLADKDSPDRNKDFSALRQKLDLLPNHSNNVVVGTSNEVTMEPDMDGRFPRSGSGYSNGDPARYRDVGIFLFLDGSVSALGEDELAKMLSDPGT